MELDLPRGQCLCEDVCCHVIGGAEDEFDDPTGNHLADEMVPYIDMLGLCMEVVSGGQLQSSLVVTVEDGWCLHERKKFSKEAMQPHGLL